MHLINIRTSFKWSHHGRFTTDEQWRGLMKSWKIPYYRTGGNICKNDGRKEKDVGGYKDSG